MVWEDAVMTSAASSPAATGALPFVAVPVAELELADEHPTPTPNAHGPPS